MNSSTDSLVNTLEKVIADFNALLNELVGESFRELSAAMVKLTGKLESSVSSMCNFVEQAANSGNHRWIFPLVPADIAIIYAIAAHCRAWRTSAESTVIWQPGGRMDCLQCMISPLIRSHTGTVRMNLCRNCAGILKAKNLYIRPFKLARYFEQSRYGPPDNFDQ